MAVHEQAWIDILKHSSEKLDTVGNLAWVKPVPVDAPPSKNYDVKTRKVSRKLVSDPYTLSYAAE